MTLAVLKTAGQKTGQNGVEDRGFVHLLLRPASRVTWDLGEQKPYN